MNNKEIKIALRNIYEHAKTQNLSFVRHDNDKIKGGIHVHIVNETFRIASEIGYHFAWKSGVYYIYGGTHWGQVVLKDVGDLMSEIAILTKINSYSAQHHRFKEELTKQFKSAVRTMEPRNNLFTLMNLNNGTLEIHGKEVKFRAFDKADSLEYILSYSYDPKAECPEFKRVLNEAIPIDAQMVLQEYIGSIFLYDFNCEKVLFMYGTGANSKSLIINIISAALGKENVVNRSIKSLCDDESKSRADLEGKLLNICTEMGNRFEIDMFNQLVSKEPVPVRRLYNEIHTIYHYASMLFACNSLPKNTEQTVGFFRRLIILPFERTIPEEKRDTGLGARIIKSELPGVLNWIIEGVKRISEQRSFSKCKFIDDALKDYKVESDSVASFIDDYNYVSDNQEETSLKHLFSEYNTYCKDSNLHACSIKSFSKRLEALGLKKKRVALGISFLVRQKQPVFEPPKEVTSSMPDLTVEDFFPIKKDEALQPQ